MDHPVILEVAKKVRLSFDPNFLLLCHIDETERPLIPFIAQPGPSTDPSPLVIAKRVHLFPLRPPSPGADRLLPHYSFVPLPKSASPDRIHSNALLYDFALDQDDMTKLDGLDKGKEGAVSWNPVDFP
jgi:hypothetical protein